MFLNALRLILPRWKFTTGLYHASTAEGFAVLACTGIVLALARPTTDAAPKINLAGSCPSVLAQY